MDNQGILPMTNDSKSPNDDSEFTPISAVTDQSEIPREIFNREFADLRKQLEDQKTLSLGIVYGVVVVFIVAIFLAIMDVNKFHFEESVRIQKYTDGLKDEITKLNYEIVELKKATKSKNPTNRNDDIGLTKTSDSSQ